MSENIFVAENALEQGSKALEIAMGDINGHLKTIEGLMGEISTYWQGPAASSYIAVIEKWKNQSQNLNNSLLDLKNALDKTRQSQIQTEEEQKSSIASLDSLLLN